MTGCNAVIFDSNAIRTIRSLRQIELNNIGNLTFEEFGVTWKGYVTNVDINAPTLKILIRNSRVEMISSYTFTGRISNITFENVVVANVEPFAFSSLELNQRIDFTNVTTENVHPQAFKKFTTAELSITNSNVTYLPSRSFSELTVTDNLLINNSSFGSVRSGAFLIHNPKRFEVTDTKFDVLDGEAFRVMTRGDVVFKNVSFNQINPSAFLGISVNLAETSIRNSIIFNSPTFNTFDQDTLAINSSSFDLKLANVLIYKECDCTSMEILFSDLDQVEELYCSNEDSFLNYVKFKNENCLLYAANTTLVIVICVTLILAIIMGAVLWCYFKKIYRCDKYGGGKDKKKKLSMIVPDGRTYRETELHVIVERTDLLTTDL